MLALHDKRRCKCAEHRGDETWHGRSGGYHDHGCRCERCRAGHAAYKRAYFSRVGRKALEQSRLSSAAHKRSNPLAERARAKARRKRYEAVDGQATRVGATWTRVEDLTVMRADLEMVEMAAVLQRTVASVMNRRRKLRKEGLL